MISEAVQLLEFEDSRLLSLHVMEFRVPPLRCRPVNRSPEKGGKFKVGRTH